MCTDLAFALRLRKTSENLRQKTVDEGYSSSHRLKWGPLSPNSIVSYSMSGKKEEGKEGPVDLCVEFLRIGNVDD